MKALSLTAYCVSVCNNILRGFQVRCHIDVQNVKLDTNQGVQRGVRRGRLVEWFRPDHNVPTLDVRAGVAPQQPALQLRTGSG